MCKFKLLCYFEFGHTEGSRRPVEILILEKPVRVVATERHTAHNVPFAVPEQPQIPVLAARKARRQRVRDRGPDEAAVAVRYRPVAR